MKVERASPGCDQWTSSTTAWWERHTLGPQTIWIWRKYCGGVKLRGQLIWILVMCLASCLGLCRAALQVLITSVASGFTSTKLGFKLMQTSTNPENRRRSSLQGNGKEFKRPLMGSGNSITRTKSGDSTERIEKVHTL